MTTNNPSITLLPVKALSTSKGNVRKSKATPEEDAELRAGIMSVGVLNALLVKHAGHNSTGADLYAVVAGGRRLSALQHLIKDKKLPVDYQAPCIILDPDADEGVIGLIENNQRAGMHPIDEYEAFHDLHFKKHVTIADIAAQHGKSQLEVKKRLALGGVHPDIRAECRAGTISADTLECYAGTSDLKKQLKIYQALKKQKRQNQEWSVRQLIDDGGYSSDDDIVKFVTVDAYTAAGGAVDEDLFAGDEDAQVTELRLLDKSLVEKLALAKLDELAVKHGKGWKWAKAEIEFSQYNSPYSQIHAEKGGFTDKQKESSGVIVTIKHGGLVNVIKGLVRKGDEKAAKSASKSGKAKKPTKTGDAGYSAALKDDLDYHKLAATKLALLELADPALLVSAMHFGICQSVLDEDRYGVIGMSMKCDPGAIFLSPSGRQIEADLDSKLDAHTKELSLEWIKKPTTAEQFQAFLKLTDTQQAELAGFCALRMLTSSDIDDNPGPDLMLKDLNANLANYWRPTAETFFSRVPATERLRIAAAVLGEKEAPAEFKKMKSAAQSKYLEDKVRDMPAATCWMPDGVAIQEPKAAAAPKAKAKKGAKK